MNKFDMVREAMAEARATINAADRAAGEMARLLQGRLRQVDRYTLVALKRELQHFNANTKEWRD